MMKLHKQKSGFTLVELLVVIGIIIMLAGIALPVIFAAQHAARKATCINNLRQLGTSAMLYADESDQNCFPWAGEDATATDHVNLLVKFDRNLVPETFKCPASSRTFRSSCAGRSSRCGWPGSNFAGPRQKRPA